MNIFNIFGWLKESKKGKNKKKDKKKIIIIESEQKVKNKNLSDTFIDYYPTQPFFIEKENNNGNKQTNLNKKLEEDKKKFNQKKDINTNFVTTSTIFSSYNDKNKTINKKNTTTNNNKDNIKDKNNQIDNEIAINTPTINNKLNEINIHNDILKIIEKNLKKDYYEISKIKYELNVLTKKERDELTIKETEKLIEKLNYLIKIFEILKAEFYAKNYDKLETNKINIPYINDLIDEYKTSVKNNITVDIQLPQIEKIEEYIQIINNMVSIEKNTSTLNNKLDDKKNKLSDADKEIENFENEYKSIEKINVLLETFSNQQDLIINDLKSKIETSQSITKTMEYKSELYINYSKLLTATLLMATTQIIPPTRGGNLLKIGLIATSLASLTGVVKTTPKEYKTTTKIDIIDYETNIKKSLDNINDIDKIVNNSIKDIKTLKKNFIKEFDEYSEVIPEYTLLLTKLDSLEKELIVKNEIIKEYEEKLNDTLNSNKVKVKRLQEEHFN